MAIKFMGVATAAHQIEGDNFYNDWWEWEEKGKYKFKSGKACNSYILYKNDREAIQDLGCNSYRLSIEWSRIEKKPGQYDEKEIEHYREVLIDLRENGIEPFVTLHHFTNPAWFEDSGGWTKKENVKYFLNYVQFVSEKLKDLVSFWITINEPNIYTSGKYLTGFNFHPFEVKIHKAFKVYKNLINAHKEAYKILKKVNPEFQVSLCCHYNIISAIKNSTYPLNWLIASFVNKYSNYHFYNEVYKEYLDFLSVNFYSRLAFGFSFKKPFVSVIPDMMDGFLIFDQHPEDIVEVLNDLSRYKLPIMITENGYLSENDEERSSYLKLLFEWIKQYQRDQDQELLGYFHWSLVDNFEWNHGFGPKFGLYKFNPQTFERIPKPSSQIFAQIVKELSG